MTVVLGRERRITVAQLAELEPRVGHRVELELVDESRNALRFYRLAVLGNRQLSLFGELPPPILLVQYGRVGKRGTVKRERHTEPGGLARRWRELLLVRKRHGYAVTAATREI